MKIKIKRAYEAPSSQDGKRVLVDRLWPRGIKKEDAKVDLWLRDIAPSDELRKWFGHDPEKWGEFEKRFTKELEAHADDVEELRHIASGKGDGHSKTLTLVYAAKDEEHNNAVVIKNFLEHH